MVGGYNRDTQPTNVAKVLRKRKDTRQQQFQECRVAESRNGINISGDETKLNTRKINDH